MFYYTDVAGISVGAVGLLFLIARGIDAFADPVVGILADKTNTKWGKYRPWILIAPIFLIVLNVLTFSVPDISHTGKLIYACITYLLLGMVYSTVNIPYGSMTAVLTQDTDERASLTPTQRKQKV
jgi:Na+/melibiose symporter-like transporter